MEYLEDSIHELARKHAISESAARQLVDGLLSTDGGQVQFNIPEFGGMGQWMPGMVMAGDLFNHALKARVDTVCSDIAQQIRSGAIQPPPSTGKMTASSLSWSGTNNWWPGDLGIPASSGAQNNLR